MSHGMSHDSSTCVTWLLKCVTWVTHTVLLPNKKLVCCNVLQWSHCSTLLFHNASAWNTLQHTGQWGQHNSRMMTRPYVWCDSFKSVIRITHTVLTTRNKWNNRNSPGDFPILWKPRIGNFVVEIISICYFPKIWWYKFIDCLIPLHRVLVPLEICIYLQCFAMLCGDSHWLEMIHSDSQWFVFWWQSYSLKRVFNTGIYMQMEPNDRTVQVNTCLKPPDFSVSNCEYCRYFSFFWIFECIGVFCYWDPGHFWKNETRMIVQ